MATLTNTKIKDTYDGLLKTTNNEAIAASGVTLIEDGLGNASALSVGRSGNGVTITGSLNATLATAAQPNITSVGTLSSLAVSGNLTVDTNTLYVDASNNRVGIGTLSPAVPLHAQRSDDGGISLFRGTSNAQLELKVTSGDFIYNSGNGTASHVFQSNGSEKVRIDASGRVGIGTSPESILHIAGTDPVITIEDNGGGTANTFEFKNITGSLRLHSDHNTDTEVVRFPRTGGISFNAGANALDDYEEGTFTPEVADAASGGNLASGSFDGTYTKIGRLVTVTVDCNNIDTTGMTGGNTLFFRNLPFTALQDNAYGSVVTHEVSFNSASYTFMTAQAFGATNYAVIRQCGDSQADFTTTVSLIDGVTSDVYFTLSYIV